MVGGWVGGLVIVGWVGGLVIVGWVGDRWVVVCWNTS